MKEYRITTTLDNSKKLIGEPQKNMIGDQCERVEGRGASDAVPPSRDGTGCHPEPGGAKSTAFIAVLARTKITVASNNTLVSYAALANYSASISERNVCTLLSL